MRLGEILTDVDLESVYNKKQTGPIFCSLIVASIGPEDKSIMTAMLYLRIISPILVTEDFRIPRLPCVPHFHGT